VRIVLRKRPQPRVEREVRNSEYQMKWIRKLVRLTRRHFDEASRKRNRRKLTAAHVIDRDHMVPISFVKNHPDIVKRLLVSGPVFVIGDDYSYGPNGNGPDEDLETEKDLHDFLDRQNISERKRFWR
jgi:hypothetical protein